MFLKKIFSENDWRYFRYIIGGITSFQNGLNDLFNASGFYFKSKVIEGSHRGEG